MGVGGGKLEKRRKAKRRRNGGREREKGNLSEFKGTDPNPG